MTLTNLLGITDQAELARFEEEVSKRRALELFSSGLLDQLEVGTFRGLAEIHRQLFSEIYDFAGKMRTVNIAEGQFRFSPVMYLGASLSTIDAMPQATFDEIVEKYVEMNVAHPFREGNGRAMRIWINVIFKSVIGQVVDWNLVDKKDYLLAMERSPIKDVEIKFLLKTALTNKVADREVYTKGIDASYYFEGYNLFKTQDL